MNNSGKENKLKSFIGILAMPISGRWFASPYSVSINVFPAAQMLNIMARQIRFMVNKNGSVCKVSFRPSG